MPVNVIIVLSWYFEEEKKPDAVRAEEIDLYELYQ